MIPSVAYLILCTGNFCAGISGASAKAQKTLPNWQGSYGGALTGFKSRAA